MACSISDHIALVGLRAWLIIVVYSDGILVRSGFPPYVLSVFSPCLALAEPFRYNKVLSQVPTRPVTITTITTTLDRDDILSGEIIAISDIIVFYCIILRPLCANL